jgi:hypothetical protein
MVSGRFIGILAESPTDGTYPKQGFIENIGFVGTDGAVSAVEVKGRSHIIIRHVFVNHGGGTFSKAGIRLESDLETSMYDCLIQNSGSATDGAVEVDGTVDRNGDTRRVSTTFYWFNNRISGNANAMAGLMLDRVEPFYLVGGNIESSGIPLKIASRPEGVYRTGPGIVAAVDLENPRGDHYIDCGYGWTGPSSYLGCYEINFSQIDASPSGSKSAFYGIRLEHSFNVSAGGNSFGLEPTGASVVYYLDGNTNEGFAVHGATGSSGTQTLVAINGTPDPAGSIDAPYYYQDGHGRFPKHPAPFQVGPNSCMTFTEGAVRGANVGMSCSVAPSNDPGPQLTWSCFVPSSSTVAVRLCNVSSQTAFVPPLVYNFAVTH